MVLGDECCIRIVLLDLDGTVIDTMGIYSRKAAELISRAVGIGVEEAIRLYLELAGRPFIEQLQIIGVPPDVAERLSREFEEWKMALFRSIEVDPRVVDEISSIRRRLKVYISTNNECNVVSVNSNLADLVDGILCYDRNTGSRKGDPHVNILLEKEGVEPCNILFIGDSEYDVEVYSRLGLRVHKTKGLWADHVDVESLPICRKPL